ncbi:MAG: hypothetical protein WCY21_07540, partial [Candidatus Cloacimonadaceae bacterium]|nr:hypothetical protein [Candidatus Cloacimonadota bacterium]
MPSTNLRNNELEFTPTFGTQLSYGADYGFIHDRFYIKTHGMVYDSALLECHFPCPDSLHVF